MRLAWRDIAVRYKQTSIGVAWAILQPFLTMVVFTLVFGKFARLLVEGPAVPDLRPTRPSPLDVLRLPVSLSSSSVVSSRAIVTKVYFPACSFRWPG